MVRTVERRVKEEAGIGRPLESYEPTALDRLLFRGRDDAQARDRFLSARRTQALADRIKEQLPQKKEKEFDSTGQSRLKRAKKGESAAKASLLRAKYRLAKSRGDYAGAAQINLQHQLLTGRRIN